MAVKSKYRPDIAFDPLTHEYLVDGKEMPSVTTILQPLSNRAYKLVNPSVLEYARNRGTAVHEALEVYDLGGDLEVVPETAPYIRAYLEWESVYKPKWIGVEQIVCHTEQGYVGTLDRIGRLNDGRLAIVDIKTSNPSKEALVSVCCQTAAYLYAWVFGNVKPKEYNAWIDSIKRYGLFLKPDGSYRFQDCDEYEDKHGFCGGVVFFNLLATHRTITQILETKERKG